MKKEIATNKLSTHPDFVIERQDKLIDELKAKIKELEAAKPKDFDKNKYKFHIDKGSYDYIYGEIVRDDIYRIGARNSMNVSSHDYCVSIQLSENDLQIIITTLQKVLDDGVLRK